MHYFLHTHLPAPYRLATAMLYVCVLLYTSATALPPDSKKHDSDTEIWSLITRCVSENDPADSRFFGCFFVSGRFLMLSGNFIYHFSLNEATGAYTYEGDSFIPPFHEISHDHTSLNERFGPNTISTASRAQDISMHIESDSAHTRFHLSPGGTHIRFDDVFPGNGDRKQWDWYILPGLDVTCTVQQGSSRHAYRGTGYFQHSWGQLNTQYGDWLYIHCDDGTDYFISYYPAQHEEDFLPPDNIIISRAAADTHYTCYDFTYSVENLWTYKPGTRFPTRIAITIPEEKTRLQLRAITDKQVSKLIGKEKWVGFFRVTATVEGHTHAGWAYASPKPRE
jgi:hypothetical protein